MKLEQEEGLVLKSVPFRDREKIITLFTKNHGLISLIVKGITRKKSHLLTLTSPFTLADYHYSVGRTDLYRFHDGTPLETHAHIRNSLSHIEAATSLATALLTSQMPHKPAPRLYALTLAYLSHLPSFTDPTPLTTSFLLKLLKHDGHLSLSSHCSHCSSAPTHLHLGEPFCSIHRPPQATSLTPEEWTILRALANARQIATLQETTLPGHSSNTVEQIFNGIYKRECERGDSNPQEVSFTTTSR